MHERVLISKKYDMSEEIPQANPSVSNETAPVAPAPVAAAPAAPAAPVSAPKPVAPAVELPKAKFAAAAKPVSVAAPKNVVNVEEKPSILAIAVDVVAAASEKAFTVSVTDEGPGMKPEELDKLFLPFVRGSAEATGSGFGLGLAIAKRAVERHGGTLTAQNVAPHGLKMTITIPFT